MAELEEEGFSFEINEDIETQEEGQGSTLGPGIHEGVYLEKVTYSVPDPDAEKAPKWKEALDFHFVCRKVNYQKDSHGNIIPTTDGGKTKISNVGDTLIKREFFDVDKTNKEKFDKLLKRVKHILIKFMTPEEAVIKGKNFKDLCNNIIKKLEGKYEDKPLRLKVIAQGKYSQVPYYMPFLELESKKPSSMQISAKELKGSEPTKLADLEDDGEISIPE